MKTKTSIIGLTIISLFIGLIGVNATVSYSIEYPEEVLVGENFAIKVYFTYETETDTFYSAIEYTYIYIYYSVNDIDIPTSASGDNILRLGIAPTHLQPEYKIFTIRTDSPYHPFNFTVGDIFRFRLRYFMGVLQDNGDITQPLDSQRTSPICTITIVDELTPETGDGSPIDISFVSIFISLMILSSLIVIVRKKTNKKDDLK